MLLGTFLLPQKICGQGFHISAGGYFFTDNTASEFYYWAPEIYAGFEVWKKSGFSLEAETGLGFNSIRYNDHHHLLFLVPLSFSANYEVRITGSRIWPVFGCGMILLGKADVNKSLDKIHYALTWGFQLTPGLRIALKKNWILQLDMSYNLLIPPVADDINLSGVSIAAGFRLPYHKSK